MELDALTNGLSALLEEALEDALPLTETAETDLKDLEEATLAAMQRIGQRFLKILIEACQTEQPEEIECRCGGTAEYVRQREGTVITLLGQIRVRRAYYLCEQCHAGTYPLDERLGFRAGALSGALEEALALVGGHIPFELASDLVERLTRVSISDNGVRQATEQIGQERLEADTAQVEAAWEDYELPAPPAEAPRVLYGSVDETSVNTETGWRNPKLGSWYTTSEPPWEEPPDDWEPRAEEITYYGDITSAEEFGRQMYVTGVQRGAELATVLIFIADGAAWIWKQIAQHFPEAVQIVDWFHATEYIWAVAHAVYGEDSDLAQAWANRRLTELWDGNVRAVVAACRKHLDSTQDQDPTRPRAARRAITYYFNNRHRMRYPEYRARGYQIGSGTIESGCKRVIGARLKQAGMKWTVAGARQVIKARAMYLCGEWDDFCNQRQILRRSYRRSQAA